MDRRWFIWSEVGLAAVAVGLCGYSVGKWQGWIGGAPMYRPWPFVLLAGALAAQAVSALVRRYYVWLAIALQVAGVVLLVSYVLAG